MKNGETIWKRETKRFSKQPVQLINKLTGTAKKIPEIKKQDFATFMQQDDEMTTSAECVAEPCSCQLVLCINMSSYLKPYFLHKNLKNGKIIAYCGIIPAK